MSLEEAIEHAEDIATSAIGCECRDEHRQLVAWLRELVERREAPEVVFCKDCRKHNVKVGFDENFHTVWKEDACPLVDWRGKAKSMSSIINIVLLRKGEPNE